MTEIFTLLWGGWRLIALLSMQGVIVGWLLKRLTRHSIALWIQREEVQGAVRLRLAIQNNEGVPLRGPATLRVALNAAQFIGTPVVYAGCKSLTAEAPDHGREWRLRFEEMPPYDSWMVECFVSTLSDVTLTLSDGDSRPNHTSARLCGTEASTLVGTEVSPDPLLACLTILASEASYFSTLLALTGRWPTGTDGLVGIGLGLFGMAAYVLIARKPNPVMQGYWKPSSVATTDC